MYLFRLMALAHEPLPFTFAITLCLYLLFWSFGVFFSSRLPGRLTLVFALTGLMVATTPYLYELDRFSLHFSMAFGSLIYFLPCIGFGLLYGLLVSRSNRDWGTDVGRYYAYNTLGSCLGILSMTLIGYELPLHHAAFVVSVGIFISLFYWLASSQVDPPIPRNRWRVAMLASCIGLVAIITWGVSIPYSISSAHGFRSYWGRDGVVEVFDDGNVYIDGLWHTHLSPRGQHIGKSYTWMMAVAALLARNGEPAQDILVIGNGVGLTASTFAGQPGVRIDAYEINRTLKEVLRDYEAETLGVGRNPQIKIKWMDARSGLALNTKRYDIIVSAPLYLRQAGSSTLLSQEYFELLERRLKPKGVIAVYAHEGAPAQSTLVRRTIASVFEHQQTFDKHVVLIASNDPIRIDRKALAKLENQPGLLAAQLRNYGATRPGDRRADLLVRVDRPSAPIHPGKFLITDDHPLVEYQWASRRLVEIESVHDGGD
jgi:protein-L-isoaspartate O-methyltransferase